MLKIDQVNNWFLSQDLTKKWEKALSNFSKKVEAWEVWFVNLDENNDVKRIKKFVKKVRYDFENIVVLWIWWSALWARAILTALKWKYYNELSRKKRWDYPKIHILDNVDPVEIKNLLDVIDLEETIFIVISKSWTTIETLSQYNFFREKMQRKWLNLLKHFIFVAWEKSDFLKEKFESGFEVFGLQENVWWRFSVLSNVGLLPLAFAWIDIEKILNWLTNYKKIFFENNLIKNSALNSALLQFDSYKNNSKNITVFFPYYSNLKELWFWYKQIFNESLWKEENGPTLTISVWTTDQHSDLQLYIQWIKDKFIIFLEVENFEKDYKIEKNKEITFADLMHIEKYATQKSLTDHNVPNYTIKVDKIDEQIIWELIFFFEMQIAFLWELLEINAFDQPWVEFWKKIANERIKELFPE